MEPWKPIEQLKSEKMLFKLHINDYHMNIYLPERMHGEFVDHVVEGTLEYQAVGFSQSIYFVLAVGARAYLRG